MDDVDEPSEPVRPLPDDIVASDHLLAQRLQQEEMKMLNERQRYQRLHSNSNRSFSNSFDHQPRPATAAGSLPSGAASASSSSFSRNRTSSSRTRNNNREDRLLNFALSEADLFSPTVSPQDIQVSSPPGRFEFKVSNFLTA